MDGKGRINTRQLWRQTFNFCKDHAGKTNESNLKDFFFFFESPAQFRCYTSECVSNAGLSN